MAQSGSMQKPRLAFAGGKIGRVSIPIQQGTAAAQGQIKPPWAGA